MASIYCVLIKTHHMTSRKKILTITKAAKRHSCSVILKTGGPPGIMIAEGEGAMEWMEVVKKLRYKDYQLMKKEAVDSPRLLLSANVPRGTTVELTSTKELSALLMKDEELYRWWRVNMGYQKDEDAP
ncbi:hypothetical protein F5884DRAFT_674790 [Xylogone sp. PMI_703]|nr:hypothetical protein F5884DRAFT_674790 [Xylogone sp. PMI_703]